MQWRMFSLELINCFDTEHIYREFSFCLHIEHTRDYNPRETAYKLNQHFPHAFFFFFRCLQSGQYHISSGLGADVIPTQLQ